MKTTIKDLIVYQVEYYDPKCCVIVPIVTDNFDFHLPDGSEHSTNLIPISKMLADELHCSIVFTGDNCEKDAEKEIIVLREKLIGATVEVKDVGDEYPRLVILELA